MDRLIEHLTLAFQLPLASSIAVFTLIFFAILISPILFKRLNIPGLVVLIFSGMLIGPHGVNLISKSSTIDLFGTIGLLYIMFMAGLEVDLNDFRKTRNKSLLFGFLTFIIPLTIGYPICYYFLGFSNEASFLVASMFATHTLVSYPIASKLGVVKNESVAVAVGGTILTDTAVLLILALILGSSSPEGLDHWFWLNLVGFLGLFLFILFFLVPRVSKWFFRKLESEKHSHYVYVLFIVFLSAFLSELAGIEPIIGAFFAGLALNKLVPNTSPLMNRIEFIGNSIFIPFFLISVGMIINVISVFNSLWSITVAVTLIIIALTGKWLAAFITRILLKFSLAQQNLLFGLSSSHAAATLAIILVGFKANLVDETILNGTVLLILVTCVFSTLITQKAAKTLVLAEDPSIHSRKQDYEHFLIPIANFQNMERILDFAMLIRNKKSSIPITLLSVVPDDIEAEQNVMLAKSKLQTIVKYASSTDTHVEVIAAIDFNVASGVARTSKELMTTIILQGWSTRLGIVQKLIGHNTENVQKRTNKMIVFCQILHHFGFHSQVVIIAPPHAELEAGFALWVTKCIGLARELRISAKFVLSIRSKEALGVVLMNDRKEASINYQVYENWQDLTIMQEIKERDLVIFISAREGSISYQPEMDSIQQKMETKLENITKFIIYPYQF